MGRAAVQGRYPRFVAAPPGIRTVPCSFGSSAVPYSRTPYFRTIPYLGMKSSSVPTDRQKAVIRRMVASTSARSTTSLGLCM